MVPFSCSFIDGICDRLYLLVLSPVIMRASIELLLVPRLPLPVGRNLAWSFPIIIHCIAWCIIE